jgi:[ribosomal protein S5]-alanine N-acetyltransferase
VTFSLLQLSKTELEALAASRVPARLEARMEPDSMPPAFVASRALELAVTGHPLPWATTFLIVNDEDARIIGGCGFKTGPTHGRVEVGYGVAPSAQGRGAASKALQLLVRSAFEAGATEVLAEVAPTNHASTRVVQKAGFEKIGFRIDNGNEYVVQWVKRSEASYLESAKSATMNSAGVDQAGRDDAGEA